MEANKKPSIKKRPATQFNESGSGKKEKWNDFSGEHENSSASNATDTVYRILCPSKKIGGVIGKSGTIIKALREETGAKVTVSDSVPGSDERVIMIYSSSTKSDKIDVNEEKKDETMQPHCAAQDALMKVHDRIAADDLFGGMAEDEDSNDVATIRLLVPNNLVGCILGKGGDVIQRLRNDTGASIRVLPVDHLPTCATGTDELVQISGNPVVVKRALYEVSTRLHQNPRKDKPASIVMPFGRQGFHHPGLAAGNTKPPTQPMWAQQNAPSHMPPRPWMGGYGSPPRSVPGVYDSSARRAGDSAEFSMKILCLASKTGSVIGTGGSNVRQLQQETGANIHVEDAPTESKERVIRVSASESLWEPRSQTIDAILHLQSKTSELSTKGVITTRILVPSGKVGCIIGQAGSIINEMRWRTKADIRVLSKDDRPECASEDEELVQVSGSFAVAKDALTEITSRLRTRSLKGSAAGAEPATDGPLPVHGHAGSFLGRGITRPVHAGSSAGYGGFKGGVHDYEPLYPVPPSASGYPSGGRFAESKYPNLEPPISAPGSKFRSNISESPDTRLKLQDHRAGGPEAIFSMKAPAPRHILNPNFMPHGGQNNLQQGSYANLGSQQAQHTQQVPYQSVNNPQRYPYQQSYVQPSPYQNIDGHHSAYHNTTMANRPYQY